MGRRLILCTLATGALVIGMSGFAGAAGQHGSGRAGATGRGSSRPAQQTSGRPRRAHPAAGAPSSVPLMPPFPNIATLSGPLPNRLNGPPSDRRQDRFATPRGRFRNGSSFYPGLFYSGGYAEPDVNGAAPGGNGAAATGMLRLEVTPGSAQVLVDGYYVGTVDDIYNSRGLVLPEGPHRIEVRAPGYESSTFDVRIAANDVVNYRKALDAGRPPAPPASATQPATATTIYMIPGCYMGNVPPRPDRVGRGCDVSQVRTIVPPQKADAVSRNPSGR